MPAAQIFWSGTQVPMSKARTVDYSSLTANLYHRWYDGPRPVIRTLSQMSVDPKLEHEHYHRRLAEKWAVDELKKMLNYTPLYRLKQSGPFGQKQIFTYEDDHVQP